MSDVDLIVFVFHLSFKCQGVIEAATFSFHSVLVVADVFAVAVPSNASSPAGLFIGIKQGLLSLVVGAVRLY